MITENKICFVEVEKKMVEKLNKVRTKHRFQESVPCRDRDDEWRMSVLGRVRFVRDSRAGN